MSILTEQLLYLQVQEHLLCCSSLPALTTWVMMLPLGIALLPSGQGVWWGAQLGVTCDLISSRFIGWCCQADILSISAGCSRWLCVQQLHVTDGVWNTVYRKHPCKDTYKGQTVLSAKVQLT
jgi:hypothetical protein